MTFKYFAYINVLIEQIAKCTESNKPEQKLLLAESEKRETTAKIDSLNKLIEDLSKTITGKDKEIQALKQNVEVLNRELFLSDKKQLQENEELKHNVILLEQNVEVLHRKRNSDAESNQQIMTKINHELKSCENKIQNSHVACFY